MDSRFKFMMGVASLVACVGANAAITYFGTVITDACGTRKETAGVGLNQTGIGGAAPGLSCSSQAQNAASPGELKIGATSVVSGAASFGRSGTSSQAYFAVDDLVFTGPGPTASGVMRLHVDGLLDNSTSMSGTQINANSEAVWLLAFNSTFGASEIRASQSTFIISEEGDTRTDVVDPWGFGALVGYAGGTMVIELPFKDVATNGPLPFFLNLYGETRAQASGCVSDALCRQWTAGASGELNFMSTVSFAREGPTFVFDGTGYAAQSASLGIVDSVWTTPVPEPSIAGLLLPGIGAVAWVARRRTGKTG